MIWIGRDLKNHLLTAPLGGNTLIRAPSNHALSTSRDGPCSACLDNLLQCLTTLTANNFFLIFNLNLSSLKIIPPCPVTTCHYKKSLCSFPVGSLWVLEGCYEVSAEPFLVQSVQLQLSQHVFIEEVLQPSDPPSSCISFFFIISNTCSYCYI